MSLHICLFDRACWREWWEFGAPMRIHVGDRARNHAGRYWEIPGFGWRGRQLWGGDDAEAVEVTVKPRLASVISIRLTADEHDQLREIAERDEVGYTQLVRDWVRERLTRETLAALPDGPPIRIPVWSRESATWTCPHLSASGPLVSMRCWVCGPLPGPTTITYRVAS